MNRFQSALCATLALTFAVGSALPVAAVPLPSPKAPEAASAATDVQYRRDRFERRGNRAYYNGRRGYRERRAGYRRYNGYWFPPAAFIAGAIIGGAITRGPASGNSHVSWCANRWRSYRAYDNSYQPLNGPRRVCVSPYS